MITGNDYAKLLDYLQRCRSDCQETIENERKSLRSRWEAEIELCALDLIHDYINSFLG